MRRRPSGSGEDDEGAKAVNVSEKAGKGKEMVKDTARAAKPPKKQERKASRQMSASPIPEQVSPWPRTATTSLGLEKNPLDVQTSETSEAMVDYRRRQRARQRNPWSCSWLTLATGLSAVVLLLTIVHSFVNRQLDPKGCAMSYMMPAFARFSDFDTEHTRFATKYSLYLYREGGVDEDTRVKGVPVLFIPGNAGSYKQVRPIAAEAAHYFHDVLREDGSMAEGKRALDFFSVDFNEDITAFHGQTLLDQAEYLNEAIAYILALYHNPHRSLREPDLPPPKSVIILGHSMGGVVARTMLRMPNYQEHTVNTVVTLSAPHARAPVSFDADMVDTYNDINTFWRKSYSELSKSKNPLSEVTLVSVAGGGLDTMIPSEYTSLTSLVPDTHGFTVFTSSIPNVWTGMDHLAIMWCDQFRKALVRAIFDVTDARRPSQTREQPERIRALRKRLLTGIEPVVEKAVLEQEASTLLTIDDNSNAIMPHGNRLMLRSIGTAYETQRAHVMPIPVQPFTEGSKFTLLTDQKLDNGDGNGSLVVLFCSVPPLYSGFSSAAFTNNIDLSGKSSGTLRLACKNAAGDTAYLPASTNHSVNAFDKAAPFSYLQFDLPDLAEHQFVAVIETATEESQNWVVGEFSTGAENSVAVRKGHHQLLLNGLHLRLPAERPMMTEIKIPEVHSTLFAYRFDIKRHPCEQFEESFTPLLRQYIAEPYESKYFVNARGGNINVHGISPYMPPPLSGGGASEGLSLQFWTDPSCNSTVEVSLKVDLLGSAGKLVMRYRTVFAAFPLLVVLIVLRKQFKVYDTTGVFMSFSESMDQCLRTSLPFVFIALTFLAVSLSKAAQGSWTRGWLSTLTGTAQKSIDFNVNDLMLGTQDPFLWFLVPLFGLISVGICIAMNYALLTVTQIVTFIYARIRAVTLRNDEGRRTASSFGITSAQHRIITTSILLLLVTTVIPYQFAYMVLSVVQVATCVRALRLAQDTHSSQNYNFYNYVHSMLTLMLWVLPINMPVLIVWIHNLAVHWLTPFSTHHNLLSILPYILLVEAMSTGNMVPRVTSRLRYVTNILTFLFALYAAVYGVTYAYRMHHLVNTLCAWLVLVHLSNSPASLAKLGQYLSGSATGGETKKRP